MSEEFNLEEINTKVRAQAEWITALRAEMAKVIVGQQYLIDRLLVGLLANGHVLLEGVPGLAKTLSVRTLADSIHADFARVQFTPDLLPADIIGTLIYNPKSGEFSTKKGPVFANIVLADEINRAPAKVQSALLEAMQEGQVTIGDNTFELPHPFLVLATENPIDQEGTYPLPEAQVDRFMLKLQIGYPSKSEEMKILESMATTGAKPKASAVVTPEQILSARKTVNEIYLDAKIRDYIIELVFCTREPEAHGLEDLKPMIQFGGSPRATISLTLAAKAWAFISGRGYVTPQDVKSIAADILRHRIILTYEAEAEELSTEAVIKRILETVPVP
ncbi:MoxR family ATPase [Puniceicoccales bacterium CK1056]|uniref:MoxR family ATPase n=1 Tax=Oceanipulchritudo coccoides TaxID=2706888 RepID=A0A6B2LZD1_9BACT|nr:MoxR family ATPase [Oceanipulchritudo coccoides]NDV61304.1 MoxR family ATPase [Oceanipulchritudo coccoides]